MARRRQLLCQSAALAIALAASAWAQQPGIINTVAGDGTTGFSGDGGSAVNASLKYPAAVAFDSSGNMYIADFLNCRIRKVNTAGIISTFAGTGVSGFSGDGGVATGATLNYPLGVAVDSFGNVFISDSDNNRIRKVDHSTGLISTVAGTGTAGFSGDGGLAINADLYQPHGITVDSGGNLYFADFGNDGIRRVDSTTGLISTVAGNGAPGFSGDGGPATSASLNTPFTVVFDLAGDMYIDDASNARIRRVDHATGIISTVAGNGSFATAGDGGPATSASFSFPQGIALDSAGNLYISDDNGVVRKVDTVGIINTIAGIAGDATYGGDGGPATSATFAGNYGLAVNGDTLYVADLYASRIRAFVLVPDVVTNLGSESVNQTGSASTVIFNSITGTAVTYSLAYGTDFDVNISTCSGGANYGSCSVTFTPRYPGLRRDALLAKDVNGNIIGTEYVYGIGQGPFGVVTPGTISSINLSSLGSIRGTGAAFDPAGNLYIVDSANNRVIKVDSAGNASAVTITSETLSTPTGIVVDGAGNLDIVDTGNNRVVKVSTNGAATAINPSVSLTAPTGIALATNGTLYVADTGNSRIVEIPVSDPSSVLPLATTLMTPVGLAFDTAGDLYIADTGLHSIVMLPADGTDSVLTTPFSTPTGIWIVPSGSFYVADAGLNRVLRRDPTGYDVIAGTGTPGDTGDGGRANYAELNAPTAVAVAPDGTVYITDSQTLRKILPTNLIFNSTNVGSSITRTPDLADIGNLPFPLSSTFTFGQAPSEFSLLNSGATDCTTLPSNILLAGATCHFEVRFAPTVASTDNDTLTLATGLQFSLTGTGLAVSTPGNPLLISAGILNFTNSASGSASAAQVVTLTNPGANAVSLSSFAVTGTNASDFGVTSTCGSTLLSGATCTLSVVFTPSTNGHESATLPFTDIAGGTSYSQTVALNGSTNAVTNPINTSAAGLNLPSLFVDGSGAAQSITLTNTGVDAMTAGSFTLSGINASDFTVTSTCGTTLAANASCTASGTFMPSVTGNESATLTISYADAVSNASYTQTVALTGAGLSGLPIGIVEILSRESGKAIDVLNLSMANGATIQQYDYLGGPNQQWQLVPDGSGYYTIVSVNSGKVLDDTGYSTENGTKIQQWQDLGADNQKWSVTQLSDGSFTITNKLSGKLLDVTGLSDADGALIQQWASTGANNQRWSIIAAQQYFTITNKLSGKVLDVTGYSKTDGTRIQQWTSLGGMNQEWQFVPLGNGYYQIVNHESGKVLDATDPEGTISDGTPVQQWDYLGGLNQQWQITPTGGGYFEVDNRANGMVLDNIGYSTVNGTGIQVWSYLGGANQQWSITAVH